MKKTKMKAFTLVEMALTKNRQNLVSTIRLTVELQAKRPLYQIGRASCRERV